MGLLGKLFGKQTTITTLEDISTQAELEKKVKLQPGKIRSADGGAFDGTRTKKVPDIDNPNNCDLCHKGGLSRTQHDLHIKERSAGFWGKWDEAADAKLMLDNADSASFWERKAEQVYNDYKEDPQLAARMHDICLENAKHAPNK